jgi:hypothetical protein
MIEEVPVVAFIPKPVLPVKPELTLGEDADRLTKLCTTYTEGEYRWDPATSTHVYRFGDTAEECDAAFMHNYLNSLREALIREVCKHLMREVEQPEYGSHGNKTSYVTGCRGLACRRANREALRKYHGGQSPQARFITVDAILDEADSRMVPDEILHSITYRDRMPRRA